MKKINQKRTNQSIDLKLARIMYILSSIYLHTEFYLNRTEIVHSSTLELFILSASRAFQRLILSSSFQTTRYTS